MVLAETSDAEGLPTRSGRLPEWFASHFCAHSVHIGYVRLLDIKHWNAFLCGTRNGFLPIDSKDSRVPRLLLPWLARALDTEGTVQFCKAQDLLLAQ